MSTDKVYLATHSREWWKDRFDYFSDLINLHKKHKNENFMFYDVKYDTLHAYKTLDMIRCFISGLDLLSYNRPCDCPEFHDGECNKYVRNEKFWAYVLSHLPKSDIIYNQSNWVKSDYIYITMYNESIYIHGVVYSMNNFIKLRPVIDMYSKGLIQVYEKQSPVQNPCFSHCPLFYSFTIIK